jgi:hypothetical protein
MLADTEPHPLPTGCTFLESDWRALARHWFPIAFSGEVADQPKPVRLLDEKLVIWRASDGRLRWTGTFVCTGERP